MSRSERLLDLIQYFREHRYPVSGAALAKKFGMSVRTLYRDIASLQMRGAKIEGEPGIGYVLRPGFTLPPLMFDEEELEALALGSSWVMSRADSQLQKAAIRALAKMAAVLPLNLRHQLEASGLLVLGPGHVVEAGDSKLALLRQLIRQENKLEITYTDVHHQLSQRIIWPLGLSYFDEVRVVIAWCELRNNFRHFRADRIAQFSVPGTRYPERRHLLLKRWQASNFLSVQ